MLTENFLLCYITCPSEAAAKKIAFALVENRISACCNILPMLSSIYRWQDAIQEDKEVVLLAKTIKENFPKLEQKVKELHDYECPCIIALKLEEISSNYATWLLQACQAQTL